MKFLKIFEAVSAEEDYGVEKNFAIQAIAGHLRLEQFPYFIDYRETMKAEHSVSKPGPTIFIGGGPVPISAILLAVDHQTATTVLELISEAVQLSTQLIATLRIPDIRIVHGDGAQFMGFSNFTTIYVALEAGNTREAKEAIFEQIASQAKPDATILVRGSTTENFLNVDSFVRDHFEVVRKIAVFGGFSHTYVLHCQPKAIPIQAHGNQLARPGHTQTTA